jgi:very-short-patch-repair endonuclease/DNA polymerase III delta prime subunit
MAEEGGKTAIDEDDGQAQVRTFDDLVEWVELPDAVQGFSKRRVELVQRSAEEWRRELIDLGGRNNLLSYRDLRAGTLDLSSADEQAVTALLQSKAVKTSELFPDRNDRVAQLKRIRTIHNKARENYDERGLQTLFIGCGLATWDNSKRGSWAPSSPVLLRQASLRALGAAQDEFEFMLLDEMEVNPTLIHLLRVDFECDLSPEELLQRLDGVIDEMWELEESFRWMVERARRVPDFTIEPRLVLTNFAYAKLPMVNDIENSFDELVAHELIAAIAGDEEAQESIRNQGPSPHSVPSVDAIPPADEFLVLNADSSQNSVINHALGGGSLIVRGPPGTGKSQTIANLIASLVARGKTVLFVAEKRAAIEAVLKRLNERQLGNLVLDLHAGVGSRRGFAQRIGEALVSSRVAPRVDRTVEQRRLETYREQLNNYVSVLHQKRQPWGLSVYELRVELMGLCGYESGFRLRNQQLALDRERYAELEGYLRDFVRLNGLALKTANSPWRKAQVTTAEKAQTAFTVVDELHRHTLVMTLQALRAAAKETALPEPATLRGWREALDVWSDIRQTLVLYREDVFDARVADLCEAMSSAEKGAFSRLRSSMFSGEYKVARRAVRQLLSVGQRVGDPELVQRARAACAQLENWRALGGEERPKTPSSGDLDVLFGALTSQLATVEQFTGLDNLQAIPVEELEALVRSLVDDRRTLVTLPELYRLGRELENAGLEPFIAEMRARGASEEQAVKFLRFSFAQSVLDELAVSDLAVEAISAQRHEATINDFRVEDVDHIETTPDRIRRLAAERATRAREAYPEQAKLVISQAALKRRHLPVRDVVRNAENVLLALKPCWAMSPLNVSQLLPAKPMFDVVVFDEASQITPADAIPSIVRGKQLIVAGDSKQLPPTAFFVSESDDEEQAENDEFEVRGLVGGTRGYESIIDALDPLLRWRMLQWHYRSRDERLIAFSNAQIYDRQLVTFPGVGADDPLHLALALWDPGADTNSPTPEVNLVVDLIIEHARKRPDESLGVITMGIRHSNRIEECLRQRLRDTPGLESDIGEFFAEDRQERFFVKNLERVQGDERDAIILSVGYGKNHNGSVPLRFGPLLQEGGERRLNVAITRAKNRVTLVTSFKASELELDRTNAEGVKLLSQYLQYVESGGTNLGDQILNKPALNPFEADIRDTLTNKGLRLVPQYGTSGYWIDFAVRHKTKPQFVLALECDGATYHSSESARDRDRLRQDQLERLGWRFHRIWSSEWFHHKDRAVEKVLEAFEQAVKDADNPLNRPPAPRQVRLQQASERQIADAIAERVRATFDGSPTTGLPTNRDPDGRPEFTPGLPIDSYCQADLIKLAKWIDTDDSHLLTDDELLREMMRELGFQRRGTKIVATLQRAIKQARR